MSVVKREFVEMDLADWYTEGDRLFGPDRKKWRFVCPCCGHEAGVQDWIDAGAPEGTIGFSCIGRWSSPEPRQAFGKGPGPCNYAGGGLFKLGPVGIKHPDGEVAWYMAFAPTPSEKAGGS